MMVKFIKMMEKQDRKKVAKNSHEIPVIVNGMYFNNNNEKELDDGILKIIVRPFESSVGRLKAVIRHKDEVVKSDLHYILERPNEFDTFQDLMEKMIRQYILNNNAYIIINRKEDTIVSLEVLSGIHTVSIEESKRTTLKVYVFKGIDSKGDKYKKIIPTKDVIHLKQKVDSSMYFGSNPLDTLGNAIKIVKETENTMLKELKKNFKPAYHVKYHDSLSDKRYSQLKKELNIVTDSEYGVSTIFTDGKTELHELRSDVYKPEFKQLEKSKEEIYKYFGVNEKILNNRQTEEEWQVFYNSAIIPIIEKLKSEFSYKLFSREEIIDGYRVDFDTSSIAFMSSKIIEELSSMLDRGIININESRRLLNLEAIEQGDTYLRRKDTEFITDDEVLEPKEEEEENEQEELN